ncbi:ATP synthase subunit delta [Lactobacillus helsingborgensis]|uniref:ATP synthase subunit delta n=1 Tax=Lactobacillus helsingborgensis TaxID=1218494 RepID=A0AA47GHM2_9LACO|nr:ATP synthase F1 subunit delta [Lactobacillus helsingborgensis]KJY65322.1 ATP synthase subunit delta [Lactobacillus helsingborgensis]MBC6356230.1 F0F1 ATP synthase subunit delta [Lactobacillus helsingborgensis]MCT6812934.1 ATP synthase F1 subunit delta [Lactobacillus helsingborgensis]MCT6828362.1 ATP synthase F1 subunit delta [Lactobacillus helsingborgensis]UZX30323.1 F0F1 ATP synthase subunit delta [Lactobacillus helsingborgensis]
MALSKAEIAARYGTALFDYAQDMDALTAVHADLQELAEAISNYPQILKVFSDPIFNSAEKAHSLSVIAQGLTKEVQNFLNLLLDYDHFLELPAIIDCFNSLYNQKEKIATGVAISAVALDEQQLQKLGAGYAQKYGLKKVILKNEVDQGLIGGVVLKVGDCVIDGSVKNKLNKIRAQLINKN